MQVTSGADKRNDANYRLCMSIVNVAAMGKFEVI